MFYVTKNIILWTLAWHSLNRPTIVLFALQFDTAICTRSSYDTNLILTLTYCMIKIVITMRLRRNSSVAIWAVLTWHGGDGKITDSIPQLHWTFYLTGLTDTINLNWSSKCFNWEVGGRGQRMEKKMQNCAIAMVTEISVRMCSLTGDNDQ